eukprot:10995499-Heterocapsa_arctica.AAC.1
MYSVTGPPPPRPKGQNAYWQGWNTTTGGPVPPLRLPPSRPLSPVPKLQQGPNAWVHYAR